MLAYEFKELDVKLGDAKKNIHIVLPTSLYLSEEYVPKKKREGETFKISSDSFKTDVEVFKFLPHNNVITKSLQNIIDLIETSGHLGITDIDALVNTFADLLIENGMNSINSVHAEMIAAKLITDNVTGKTVDWSKSMINPYTINRVSKIVMRSPISTSLSFERLNDQLANLETYMKDDESIMDALFE